MKKLLVSFFAICMLIGVGYSNASANTIGIKGGYVVPTNDLEDYDNALAFGLYFDMGKFVFNSLSFRPSLDYFSLEYKNWSTDVFGLHMDWYWHFMDNKRSAMAPFIGFGAALNFYDGQDDSDAGLELFGGIDFKLSGAPLLLTIEGRYKFLDIADFDQSAFELSLGIGYMF